MDSYILVAAIVITIIIFFLLYLVLFRKTSDSGWKTDVDSRLKKISAGEQNDIMTLKNNLIESDKLLDYSLKQMKVHGETLGERLKNSRQVWDKAQYNQVWQAHKLRNTLVHEVSVRINGRELATNITILKKAIKSLIS